MKKIFYLLGSLLLVLMVISGCKKSEVTKASEDYNYNGIKPIIFDLNGPAATAASGLAAVKYSCTPRGGSVFTWEVTGHGATITVGNPSYTCEILFDQSNVDVTATVTVVETTSGGMKSEPKTMDVALAKFKPMTWDDFVGDWEGTETDGDGNDHAVAFTISKGTDENTIVFPVDAGLPSLMKWLFEGWGETFQAGFGNEGRVIMQLDLLTGAVTIDCQYWGQTLPGPYDYWIDGSGTWEGFNQSMTFNYGMHWDDACDTDYNPSSMTITKK
jgi:hypothetical protein